MADYYSFQQIIRVIVLCTVFAFVAAVSSDKHPLSCGLNTLFNYQKYCTKVSTWLRTNTTSVAIWKNILLLNHTQYTELFLYRSHITLRTLCRPSSYKTFNWGTFVETPNNGFYCPVNAKMSHWTTTYEWLVLNDDVSVKERKAWWFHTRGRLFLFQYSRNSNSSTVAK